MALGVAGSTKGTREEIKKDDNEKKDFPPVECKMMKSMDHTKTEVLLFFKFRDSNYNTDQLMQLALTLLNESIGWTEPDKFSKILQEAVGTPNRQESHEIN